MDSKQRLLYHRPTVWSPACKNLRSFQTAEKGELESACLGGRLSEATCRLAPKRGHVRATPCGPREGSRKKLLVRPTRAEGNVYGRPSPTCDLVKATSVALREPSAFT